MRESQKKHVTIRIQVSEEAAFMRLLNFMYSNTLPRTTPTDLLDVLMAADKYEVASFQQLTDAAKRFLAARFKDLSKYQEEVMDLPLAGIEAVLCSDDLQVASEDVIYDLVLKWARVNYSKLEERREILSKRLIRFIRFPFMTCRKLRSVLTCGDIDPELASKVVWRVLFFKVEAPYRRPSLLAEDGKASLRQFVERSYIFRPMKVVRFESPIQCVVYLDLKRDECAQLFPAGWIHSQSFHLGGQRFILSGHCYMDQNNTSHCFGLFLRMLEKDSVALTVDYDCSARMKPSEDFVRMYKWKYMFMGGNSRSLFKMPWTAFVADDSPYFINGVLHLRAELTIKK
ncbi:POZ/BTB G-protein 1 [Salvia divinorum]|uniref:POZ/BTB G-protein 1 n=1 Tax=Salvia divinorum TaxID=28513 RepID=A0ABD1HK91_SALDI